MFALGWLELGESEKAQNLLQKCFRNIQTPFQVRSTPLSVDATCLILYLHTIYLYFWYAMHSMHIFCICMLVVVLQKRFLCRCGVSPLMALDV